MLTVGLFAPTTFAISDAFRDEAGRQAHLAGPIANALTAQAPNLLAAPTTIEHVEVLSAKLPSQEPSHSAR